jgi:hypothetical protein
MSMHKFFIVKLHKPTKLKKTGLTIMTEAAAKFAVQCRCSLVLAVLVLLDFRLAKALIRGPLKVS